MLIKVLYEGEISLTRSKSLGIEVLAASIVLLASFAVQASEPPLNEEEEKLVDLVHGIQSEVDLQPVPLDTQLCEGARKFTDDLQNNGDVGTSWTAVQEVTVNGVTCHGLLFVDSQGATAQAAFDYWMSSSYTGAIIVKQGPYKDYDAIGVAVDHECALMVFA
ncbi:MAG TPA: hypothetical protein PKK92_08735 [Methanothrix sp.]|nr:hypothetical protein [Methanothrix sp.]